MLLYVCCFLVMIGLFYAVGRRGLIMVVGAF